GERRGALVAIDPANGEVLAFVSKPGFDPNLFVDGIDPTNWDALNTSIDKPLLNRPLRGAYPPGSTIKPFLALSALTSGKRSATQQIFDPGFYQLAGSAHRFRDDKPGGHGQGYKALTPVQQAEAIATRADAGHAFWPHLVRTIENIKTGAIRDIAPRESHTVAVKPEHMALIKSALMGVAREGTSARAFVGTQYVSAGKTGTAQLFTIKQGEKYHAGQVDERLRDHAWYLAYAPADRP